MQDERLPAGGRISHYRILHRIGSGGMGEVYSGLDETLERKVALKAIRLDQRLDASAQARFLREARILSQLDHPNICRAYDYITGEASDWLVLELIEGSNLREAVVKGLDRHQRMRIAEQIAAVLVVTHGAGIVHRDLKPGNVMITPSGEVKVLDFGLARTVSPETATAAREALAALDSWDRGSAEETRTIASGAPSSSEEATQFQTRLDSLTGTLAYMSPEQGRGEPATSASDMFAYGLVLQELFTGTRAYPEGLPAPQLLELVQHGETQRPVGLDPHLTKLIRELTAPDSSQRPSASETVDRLKWIRGKPKRRVQKLAIAGAILIAAAGLLKYTLDLRREQKAAVAASAEADRRRLQAETLLNFMIDDLRPKLEKAGRLELLDDVGEKAMTYFASVPASSLTTPELSQRSKALYQIGDVRKKQNNLKAATAAFEESLKFAEAVADRDPSNPEWQLGLATAHFYIGDVRLRQGELDGAMREFTAYRDITERLVKQDASNKAWQLELSYALSNIAAVQEAKGDLNAARGALEDSLKIKQQLADADPGKAAPRKDLATAHNRLGVVLDKSGKLDEALAHYQEDLAIRQKIVEESPSDQSLKRNYYVACSFVSASHEDRGELKEAVDVGRQGIGVASTMAAVDPANADWQRDLAVAEIRLASALRASGVLPEARDRYAHAIAILDPLAKAAQTNLARQRELATAEAGLAAIEALRGNRAAAMAHASAVEALLGPLVVKKTDVEAARVLGDARLIAADVSARAKDMARATELREQALEVVTGAPSQVVEKRYLAVRARALIALDRLDEARPIVDQLTAMGYRHPLLLDEWRRKDSGTVSR